MRSGLTGDPVAEGDLGVGGVLEDLTAGQHHDRELDVVAGRGEKRPTFVRVREVEVVIDRALLEDLAQLVCRDRTRPHRRCGSCSALPGGPRTSRATCWKSSGGRARPEPATAAARSGRSGRPRSPSKIASPVDFSPHSPTRSAGPASPADGGDGRRRASDSRSCRPATDLPGPSRHRPPTRHIPRVASEPRSATPGTRRRSAARTVRAAPVRRRPGSECPRRRRAEQAGPCAELVQNARVGARRFARTREVSAAAQGRSRSARRSRARANSPR